MKISRRMLVWVYTAAAIAALIGTWGNNLEYMALGLDPLATNLHFWKETFANPASQSITVDIFWLALPVTVWVMLEARRLKIPGIWWYLVLSWVVAVSVTVPLFMAARERRLIAADDSDAGFLSGAECAWLVALVIGSVVYTVGTLL